jgi:hypothetical protein
MLSNLLCGKYSAGNYHQKIISDECHNLKLTITNYALYVRTGVSQLSSQQHELL